MPENLLTPTAVKLFGRIIHGLKIEVPQDGWKPEALGDNNFLRKQLATDPQGHPPRLARIYGFSYEGYYQNLPVPALMVVHGDGAEIKEGQHGEPTVDSSGVVAHDWQFSASDSHGGDLRYWEYDKGDFSMRLDVQTGTFEQLLSAGPSRTSGMDLRTSGMDLRTSGMDLRTSGMDLRTSGMDLRTSGMDLRRR